MQPKLILGVADKYRAIRREPTAIATIQPQRHKSRAQLFRIPRCSLQLERKLPALPVEAEQPL